MPFVIRYVPDHNKIQEMCDKVILENGGTLNFVPDYYKNKKMCDKAVNTLSSPNTIRSWTLKDTRNVW